MSELVESGAAFEPTSITRPDPALLTYYVAVAALTLVGFPFVFLPLYFKYHTLRYVFDDKGVSMSWGILFKRETYLTYRRIQDIHVTRNLFHRWLGLAAVAVQTASGSAGAEMTIEGIREPERLRDFLYAKMRGARGDDSGTTGEAGDPLSVGDASGEALELLRAIRDDLCAGGPPRGPGMSGGGERTAAWIYRGLWAGLVRWFRVPADPPTLPVAAGESIDAFRPAEGFLRYLKFWFWIVALTIDLAILVGFIVATVALWQEGLAWVAVLLVPIVVLVMVVPDVIAYVAVHLRYDTTWYVMTDRSLRIRRGVWSIQETTITFENVQNIRISQGPVQRLLGIGDLVVETAGSGGGGGGAGHAGGAANRGVLEGIADAAAVRDRILPHLRRSGRAGLGDEEEGAASGAAGRGGAGAVWTREHIAVLHEIRTAIAAIVAIES